MDPWKRAVDNAVLAGADAVILSDLGLMSYTAKKYPDFRIHLSVQAFASTIESVNFYQKEFGIKRVVLPRIFTLREIENIIKNTSVEVEIFAFAFSASCSLNLSLLLLTYHVERSSTNLEISFAAFRFLH
jgi:putative protease